MRTLLNISSFLLALPLLLATDTRAQLAVRAENQFLYNEALRVSLESMNRDWGGLDLTNYGGRARINFRDMIVRKDPAITDGLNSRFGEYRVTYLGEAQLISRWKRLRKEFATLAVRPVERAEGRLKITVILYWFSYRQSNLNFGLSDWADVNFRFDAPTGKYVVDDVKLRGV